MVPISFCYLKVLWSLALRLVCRSILEGLGIGEFIPLHSYPNTMLIVIMEGLPVCIKFYYMMVCSLFYVMFVKGLVDPRFVVHPLCAYTTGIYI